MSEDRVYESDLVPPGWVFVVPAEEAERWWSGEITFDEMCSASLDPDARLRPHVTVHRPHE